MARFLLTIAGGLLLASPAGAQGGPTGQAMAQTCYVCHGPKGNAAPPALAAGRRAILASDILNPPARWQPSCEHTPVAHFEPGKPLERDAERRHH